MVKVKDLKQDKRNYRKHDERNLNLIKKSVESVGFGRSIVIDSENEIICGNGLASTLDPNKEVKVIETDGSELVVIKRTDLKTSDAKRRDLAILDNSASDTSTWDITLLRQDFEPIQLQEFGIPDIPVSDIDVDGFFENTEEKVKEPKKVKCPHCGEEFEI